MHIPTIRVREVKAIRIDARHWFGRPDFRTFLDRATDRSLLTFPATWHRPGEPVDPDNADVFTVYDGGDNTDPLPADIWQEIEREVLARFDRRDLVIVWIAGAI